MTEFFVFLFIAGMIGLFVLQSRGGKIFNNLFRKSTIDSRRDEMKRKITWTSSVPAAEVIGKIKTDLALTDKPKLAGMNYTEAGSSPRSLIIAYGNKVVEAFRVAVSGDDTTDGHAGEFEVLGFLEQDSMPMHVDKMIKLRDRITWIVRSSGGTIS